MKSYQDIQKYVEKIADINGALALLSWDKEVNLPANSAKFRSRQMATLSSISHSRLVDPVLITAIERQLDQDLNDDQRINLLRLQRDIEQESKFSTEFVEKMSHAVSAGYHTWAKARGASDFSIYEDKLNELIQLKIEAANILGFEAHPYNALIDQYEVGMNVGILDNVFDQVRTDLVPVIQRLSQANQADDSFLRSHYDEGVQWNFGVDILKAMGYDFDQGRQDKSAHPFSIGIAPDDIRITTRVDKNNYAYMLWSTIHEGGHALYEHRLPSEQYGMPLGQAASLSIHESQSRLWENHVGRSLPFWTHYFDELKSRFPNQLKEVDVNLFYRAINKISPNLIRTEADELHYHLHVLIRYEIEKEMVTGAIKTADLPHRWNELYSSYLNIEVPTAAEGILQDVHWAFGSIGYFPTYSLGSFYAAQFYATAQQQIPDLENHIAQGNFKPLLTWLNTNIHIHGRRYLSEELCERVTGQPLDLSYFLQYINDKFKFLK